LTLLAYRARYVANVAELQTLWQQQRTRLMSRGVRERAADLATCIELSLHHPLMSAAGRGCWLVGLLPAGVRLTDLPALLPEVGIDAAANVRQVGGLTFDDRTTNRLRTLAPVRDHLAEVLPPAPEDRGRACVLLPDAGELATRLGPKGVGGKRPHPRVDNLTAMSARVERR